LTNELAKTKASLASPLNLPARLPGMNQGNGENDLNNSDFLANVCKCKRSNR